ncbi:hypothetical protein [Haloferula sp.]|uniref:hypothetical protein n=1 Tax=Haloferula sp. TaxID=2497595 RepID=UPI003C744E48
MIPLSSRTVAIDDLTDDEKSRMFELFGAAYDCVSEPRFRDDLAWKDEVILLVDACDVIQGFTTLAFNPKGFRHELGDLLFSGDTIIDPAHWGSSELVRAFCERAGRWRAHHERRLFWMLISKGHRTFLFLPLYAKRFHPNPSSNENEFREVATTAARHLFAEAWCAADGVIRFPEAIGQLKPELADGSHRREGKRMVRFFLERNPGFAHGDELVCLTELSPSNLKRAALGGYLQGSCTKAGHS